MRRWGRDHRTLAQIEASSEVMEPKMVLAVADHKISVAERTLNPFARSRRRAAGSCRPKHNFASRNCGGRGGSKARPPNRELQAKPCGLHDTGVKVSDRAS
jgi:hypothetical protein